MQWQGLDKVSIEMTGIRQSKHCNDIDQTKLALKWQGSDKVSIAIIGIRQSKQCNHSDKTK
jgi:hypothetical protein